MKRFYLIVFLLYTGTHACAQSTNISTLFHRNIKKGDYYFDRFAYRNALEIYLQQARHAPADYHVRERIAKCYFKLHDPASAEVWYSTFAGQPGIRGETMYEYAEVLSMNGKYEQAIEWYRAYLKRNPTDKAAADKLDFLVNLEKYASNEERFILTSFQYNTEYAEYGAHFFHQGVVFASSRDVDLFIKRKPVDGPSPDESFLNLYYAERNELGDWGKFGPFHLKKLDSHYHEGPMVFYDRFRKCAYTQSNLTNGKLVYDSTGRVNLRIFFADVSATGELQRVAPFEYNNDAWSNAHPSFSPDGNVMYFSSTMPGGNGASDIYFSTRENGRWTKPVNAGDVINTREDESFPFIANDTTLYFSSNGHGGFGGLDVYVSYKRKGAFIKPMNLGRPMNSRFDDFSLVCDSLGRTGFVASNEDGGRGHDDIFSYTAKYYLLMGHVREVNRRSLKIPGVKISAFNGNGDLVDSAHSDSDGNFVLDLPFDQDFKIRGEKDGFETLKDTPFSTRGKPFGIDSIMLPMWKQNLFSKGRIFSNETQAILPGVAVTLHNMTDGLTDTLVVDDTGEYSFLVKPGKKYRIEGTKEGFLPNGFNLDTKDLVEGDLLNDIVLEEVFIDKEIVLFDYNRAVISDGSAKALNTIVKMLKRFPRATVNIGAHADSRGTFDYNNRLSKRRAEATRDYLIANGIKPSRIQHNWFGEELVLNRCSDGVECPEEEHSKNRRAELKVQKEPVE